MKFQNLYWLITRNTELFIIFFLHVHTRNEEIRTSDLYFMRRGQQPIELSIDDNYSSYHMLANKQT